MQAPRPWCTPSPWTPRLALLLAAGALLGACGKDPGAATDPEAPAEADALPTTPSTTRGGLAVRDPHHAAHPGWRDLGIIPLGQVETHVIELENREGRPLTIQNLRAGCACAVPSIAYTTEQGERVTGDVRSSERVLTLPAGAVAELTIQVDSRRAPVKNSQKLVSVRLVSDSASDPYLTIELQFTVESHFTVAPERLDLGEVAEHGTAEGATRILALDELTLSEPPPAPAGFEVWLEESFYLGQTGWDLHARVVPPIPLGYGEHRLTLATRHPDGSAGPPLEVPLTATGVPDTEIEPARLLLRPMEPAGDAAGVFQAEVVVHSNLAGQRFTLSRSALDGPAAAALEVELLPKDPDLAGRSSSWTVRLTSTAELPPGPLEGTLTLATDDPALPELRVPYLRLTGG